MKRNLTISALATAAIMLSGPVLAQVQTDDGVTNGSTGDASVLEQSDVNTQTSSQMLAGDIIGMTVKNGNGEEAEKIGKVTDLVLNREQKPVNVLIGVGGFLGIGAKDVGVPLEEVQIEPGAEFAVVNMTKEQLEEAPSYKTTKMQQSEAKQEAQAQQMNQPAPQPLAPASGAGGAGM